MQFNSIQSHYLTQKNTNQETQNSAPELLKHFWINAELVFSHFHSIYSVLWEIDIVQIYLHNIAFLHYDKNKFS